MPVAHCQKISMPRPEIAIQTRNNIDILRRTRTLARRVPRTPIDIFDAKSRSTGVSYRDLPPGPPASKRSSLVYAIPYAVRSGPPYGRAARLLHRYLLAFGIAIFGLASRSSRRSVGVHVHDAHCSFVRRRTCRCVCSDFVRLPSTTCEGFGRARR